MSSRVLGIDSSGEVVGADVVTFSAEFDNGNEAGPTFALDWNAGQKQRATLTGNVTVSITDPTFGGAGNFVLVLVQDATGGRTVTWPSEVLWPGGVAPTLSAGANAVDLVAFYWDGTNYYGVASLNFS